MSETNPPSKHRIINSETLIPAGVIAAALVIVGWPCAQGLWAAARWFEAQAYEQKALSDKISSLQESFKKDAWSWPMQRDFAKELASKNPSLVVPDAKQIRQDAQ